MSTPIESEVNEWAWWEQHSEPWPPGTAHWQVSWNEIGHGRTEKFTSFLRRSGVEIAGDHPRCVRVFRRRRRARRGTRCGAQGAWQHAAPARSRSADPEAREEPARRASATAETKVGPVSRLPASDGFAVPPEFVTSLKS